MSAYKVGCPHCSQHLECDETYAGMKINCPSCQKEMMIPPPAAPPRPIVVKVAPAAVEAPAPPPDSAPRLAARPHQPAAPPPVPPAPAPYSPVAMPRSLGAAEATPSRGRSVLKLAIGLLVAIPAFYFAFQWASGAQKKVNEARAKDSDGGGGQVGHIMELHQVLDDTDPAKFSRFPDDEDMPAGGMGKTRRSRSAAIGGAGAAMDAADLPATPPAWTLDVNAAQIPGGKVCGTITKQNFVAEDTWLLTGAANPVLRFSSGGSFRDPDLDFLVYLRMKPGQGLESSTWTVASDQKGDVPQVVKRWKVGGAQQQRAFTSGYAVKLEFGKRTEGGLPGKIFVALPDEEHSVVGGQFVAFIRVVNTALGRADPNAGSDMMDE